MQRNYPPIHQEDSFFAFSIAIEKNANKKTTRPLWDRIVFAYLFFTGNHNA